MISAFSTSYFPSINYLKAFSEAKNPIIDFGDQCKKQTERIRASILTANGVQKLSVPIIRPNGNKTSTKDILISYDEAWDRNHCRSIKAAYASSPYFEDYSDEIFDLINSKKDTLIELNKLILNKIIDWLDLPIEQIFELQYIDNPNFDFREFNFTHENTPYQQVDFGQKTFSGNLSILDAIFCLGPMARKLIIS